MCVASLHAFCLNYVVYAHSQGVGRFFEALEASGQGREAKFEVAEAEGQDKAT